MAPLSAIPKRVVDSTWMRTMDLESCIVGLPPILKSGVKLGIFDILAEANSALSADEIVQRIKAKSNPLMTNKNVSESLHRLLRALATCGLLYSVQVEQEGNQLVTKYGANAISGYFASVEQDDPSFAALTILGQSKMIQTAFSQLEKTILEGSYPLPLVPHENPLVINTDSHLATLLDSSRTSHTKLFMPFLLSNYNGFQNAESLVHVCGGSGECLAAILSKYPRIRGINFDQPQMIASAPSYPGITHIGGDVFQAVPEADTILLKWTLKFWPDEHCVKILKNCYNSLPKNGKLVLIDNLQDVMVETTPRDRIVSNLDLMMLAFTMGGRVRSKNELQSIVSAAGFGDINIVMRIHGSFVVEVYKP